MSRQQGNQQAGGAHQHDAEAEHVAAAEQVADRAEHQAAHGPHQVTHRKHAEGGQCLQARILGREKGMAEGGGYIAVNGKVEPLEGIAQQGGQGGGAPLLRCEINCQRPLPESSWLLSHQESSLGTSSTCSWPLPTA